MAHAQRAGWHCTEEECKRNGLGGPCQHPTETSEDDIRYGEEAAYQGAEGLFDEGDLGLTFEQCEKAAKIVANNMRLWWEGLEH